VPPSGPDAPNCSLCLGEAPGIDENRKLIPFSGKAGREVNNQYFPIAGWSRPQIRVDNVMSCFPDRPKGKMDMKRQVDRDMMEACADHHLYPDLQRLTPKLIVPMGAFACHAIDPTIDLDLQHGIPTQTAWGTAFPMWHPAGGIHEPKKMLQIRTDWTRLRKFLIGRLFIPGDPYEGQELYKVVQDRQELRWILQGLYHSPLAIDTETKRHGDPFCLTFSVEPGTGFLILAEDLDTLSTFQQELDQWQAPVLFHNWLFDGHVLAKMAIRVRQRLVRDTMVMAFHLGNVPQGLKALAYRELGMAMQDFDDLVTPFSTGLVMDYYRQMYACEWPKPEPELVRLDNGDFKLHKAHSLKTKLKIFFNAQAKNEDKDIFKAWTTNWTDSHQMVEDELGPWPGKCITHAWADDPEAVVQYACRDADATLRIWPVLKYMRRHVRERPQENWGEGWWNGM
jgi:uracil-DNA glycosylase family 4